VCIWNVLKYSTAGDKRRPVCKRCETKGLDCKPVKKKAVFRHGSTANLDTIFAQGQTWVNSKPKNWKVLDHSSTTTSIPQAPATPTPNEIVSGHESAFGSISPKTIMHDDDVRQRTYRSAPILASSSPALSPMSSHLHAEGSGIYPQTGIPGTGLSINFEETSNRSWSASNAVEDNVRRPSSNDHLAHTAFGGIQESCLVRYFIEELSPWVMPLVVSLHSEG
jgi:hypothetical protein